MTENTDATVSWLSLLTEAQERFRRAGFDSADIDARRIVEQATGVEPTEFHSTLEQLATVRGVAAFDEMVARRLSGEPLQYVVGRWGFRYLDLMVDRRALIPRPETEVVAGLAIDEVTARTRGDASVLVADLGTGSGAIALAVASECPSARVMAADRSSDALQVARANLAGIGRAATRVTLHHGSWFDALPDSVQGSIDVMVSNPPYIANDEPLPDVVAQWEPRDALRAGPQGDEDLLALVVAAERWIAPDGAVVLEMAPDQTASIAARWADQGWTATIHGDLAGRDRAVVARRRV